MTEKVTIQVDEELADLIPGFVQNRYKDLQLIQEHLESGDYESLRRMGHTLKGICAPYGFIRMGELGQKLEDAATDQNKQLILETSGQILDILENHQIEYI